MTLWLLRATEDGERWLGYDTNDSFVVRAKDETTARQLAQNSGHGGETHVTAFLLNNYPPPTWSTVRLALPFWTDPHFSSCEKLGAGPDGIILASFNAG